MINQKVEQLVTVDLDKNYDFWVHPYTGALLYSKDDSKITIHNKISVMNQIPPDFILEVPFGLITTVSFSFKAFSIGFETGEMVIVDNFTYSLRQLKKFFKKSIKLLSLSSDNQFLLSYTDDDKLYSIDIAREKIIKEFKFKDERITGIEWLSDSKFVYTTNKGIISLIDNNTNKNLKIVETNHSSVISCLAKLPRSLYSLVTGDINGEVKVWDLDENKIYPDQINSFTEHENEILSLVCSPKGDLIFAGDTKGYVRVFESLQMRNEKYLISLSLNEPVKKIISSSQSGEFLVLTTNLEHKTGSVTLFQGFSSELISQEFRNFQVEIENYRKRIEQLPEWILNNNIEQLVPTEIPIFERNLELARKLFSEPILDKIDTSSWLKENFKELFKKDIKFDDNIRKNIDNLKVFIQNQKENMEKSSESNKKLRDDIIQYVKNLKPGRISLDQLALYFNVSIEILVPIMQKIDQEKLINGTLRSEYTGYFLELNQVKTQELSDKNDSNVLDVITCHKCGNDYSIDKKICPNCKAESISCESCLKFIQKRQMVINCPYCRAFFHLACFESKVKLFGRCPKCRETVDFEGLIRKSVNEQRHQDQIVSGLNKLLTKKIDFHKQIENNNSDDDLFDF